MPERSDPDDGQELDRDVVEAAVEEYFARRRRGESVDVETFARRVPGREREFRELLSTLEILEASKRAQVPGARPDGDAVERVGRYRLLRAVGRGGMGVVYEAIDEALDRRVALKVLPRTSALEGREVERFRREALAAAKLVHPHIVPIFGVGEDDGTHWIAMQFVDGESVAQRLARPRAAPGDPGGPLPIADVLRHGIAVADALACAHAEGVLHRDVKPSNLLVDREGEVWITDFGLAKAEGSASITRTGEMVGTPRYMAPESFSGWSDPRTDVWGLGATLYEMLVGTPAFDGADRPQLLKQISDLEPPALRRRDPRIPRDLATIVHKCLQKEPATRYASARELADDLLRLAAGTPIRARPPSIAYRMGLVARRNPTATTLLALALAGGIAMTLAEATRARAAEARERARFDDVRRLAGSFLFEVHDAIRNLPGTTKARELIVTRALEYLDRLAADAADDAALRRELASAYLRVGDVQGNPYQSNLGDLAGARQSYAKAIGLIEPLVASGKAEDEDRSVLAAAELTDGGVAVMQGAAAEAVALSTKGLALRKHLAAARPDATRRLDLVAAYQFHAFNLCAAERTTDALAVLAEQKELLDASLAEAPADASLRRRAGKNRFLAARALKRQGDQDGARAAYDAAIEIQKRLVDEDPNNTMLKSDLLWSCNDFGAFLGAIGDTTEALHEDEAALELSRALAAADAMSVDFRVALATASETVGASLVDLKRPDDALVHLNEARALCEILVRDDPSNRFDLQLMADTHVCLGCAHAMRSDPQEIGAARDDFQAAVQLMTALKAEGRFLPGNAPSLERAQRGLADCETRLRGDTPPH